MIETERTALRPIELDDNQEILSYRSDVETNKYQGWIPKTINDVNEFISKNPGKFNTTGTWFQLVITDKKTDSIIGDIGIHFIDNFQSEIGCTLKKDYHGKGFATETLKAVIDHLFNTLNKHRIIASIDPQNAESIRLMVRLGFRKEAHFKKSILINEEWVDDLVYAILKTEWE